MIKGKFIIASLGLAATLLSTTHAAVVDLTKDGSGSINGAFFTKNFTQPAGTGVLPDVFLTIQASPTEQGYNSSSGNFDTKREPQFNHEIRFSDLTVTTIAGMQYYGIGIDVNEPNNKNSTISLAGLQVFTSATLQGSTSTNGSGIFNGSLGTLRYDLGANSVNYDDQNHGSGQADISVFIPVSYFAGSKPNDYVYIYERFGNADATTEGGFEETYLIQGITPVPEMSALFPIVGLMVAVGSTHVLRRRRMAKASV